VELGETAGGTEYLAAYRACGRRALVVAGCSNCRGFFAIVFLLLLLVVAAV
jgi:hypothetical protein